MRHCRLDVDRRLHPVVVDVIDRLDVVWGIPIRPTLSPPHANNECKDRQGDQSAHNAAPNKPRERLLIHGGQVVVKFIDDIG
jgi:hypothetical protein